MTKSEYDSVARQVMTKNYETWLAKDHDGWRSTFHDDVTFIIEPEGAFTIPWCGVYVGFETVNTFNAVMTACMLWELDKIYYGNFKPNSADPENSNLCELDVNVIGIFAPTGNKFDFWMHYYVEARDGVLYRLLKTFDVNDVSRQFWGSSQLPVGQALDVLKIKKMSSKDVPLSIASVLSTGWQ
ncbi:hypothetical protein QT397_25915 [Microbulbifer sp. MKSA007]|nr:hypothetical protein QT397_25915 [Microbulbifer sp. MKSA007]